MRKPDELALYATLRALAPGEYSDGQPGLYAVMEALLLLGIPQKRGYGLLEKWCSRGWWDYGTGVRGGWFTERAPDTLAP